MIVIIAYKSMKITITPLFNIKCITLNLEAPP